MPISFWEQDVSAEAVGGGLRAKLWTQGAKNLRRVRAFRARVPVSFSLFASLRPFARRATCFAARVAQDILKVDYSPESSCLVS
eukprot:5416806-Pleurochrysis_carterae.AAC.1